MERTQFSDGAKEVLGYFYDISQIPRQSGNNGQISAYLKAFAESLGLKAQVDSAGNVLVSKPASPGCASAMPVILEAHYDMVCQKTPESCHDFSMPLELCRDGDRIFAKDTTLGADNGLGIAAIMAVLAGDMPHPPLEAVFTSSEETDMAGARGLDMGSLQGKLLLTLDSRALLCCGSGELELHLALPKEMEETPPGTVCRRLEISGLRGGHTGTNAMEEPGNAIMLLARTLRNLQKIGVEFYLAEIHGGSGSPSAFAREASCVLCLQPPQVEMAEKLTKSLKKMFADELRGRSDQVMVSLSAMDKPDRCFSRETTCRLIQLLTVMPDGVCSLSHTFPGTMESGVNCGVIESREDNVSLLVLIRSTRSSKKYALLDKVSALCALTGTSWHICHDLPQWDRNVPDEILNIAREIYHEGEPWISPGTLECGVFQTGKPELYFLGVGLPYYYQHSPSEYALVSEIALYWDKLKAFLALLAKQ